MRNILYSEALREGLDQAMNRNNQIIVIGEGVPDPKNIFGTTSGLMEKYGSSRVFDMPLSENGVTGICIGASIKGLRPVLIHQRVDFSLLSLDQIINNAAKWHYMFDGKMTVPIVIRMIIGRGWGQGPQHSQSLQGIFAQIPGLKVIMPTFPEDAKGMLISAINDNNPVIFIEHRWLHYISGNVPKKYYESNLHKAFVRKKGSHISIAAFSYMVLESIEAADYMKKNFNIEIEVIDMRSIKPLDYKTVIKSVLKTKNLIVADTASTIGSIGSLLITMILNDILKVLKKSPKIIGNPDFPSPSGHGMTKNYYPTSATIINEVISMLDIKISREQATLLKKVKYSNAMHDIPNKNFNGPF